VPPRKRPSDVLQRDVSLEQYRNAYARLQTLFDDLATQVRHRKKNPDGDSTLYHLHVEPGTGRASEHLLMLSKLRPFNTRALNLVSLAKYQPETQRVAVRITTTVRDLIARGEEMEIDTPSTLYEPAPVQHDRT